MKYFWIDTSGIDFEIRIRSRLPLSKEDREVLISLSERLERMNRVKILDILEEVKQELVLLTDKQ